MVSLYVANVSKLPDPLNCPEVMAVLPRERREKIVKYKQKSKRLQSLGAGLLLNSVLGRHGILPETIFVDSNGKPMADGISFNIAHSGDLVICAVSKNPVGCDVEQVKKAPETVETRMVSEEERQYLCQFSGEAYDREFFRIWTKKESYLKMIGTGIRVPLQTLNMQDCHFREYDIAGYQVCVCAMENEFADLSMENL